jgi:hypothetical protein
MSSLWLKGVCLLLFNDVLHFVYDFTEQTKEALVLDHHQILWTGLATSS